MDIDVFRGVVTAVLMALFIALVLWAYSRKRHDDFARLARLPLEDDSAPPAGPASKERR
jgi:cytochrome c oxidase cbb3-type subunit 4